MVNTVRVPLPNRGDGYRILRGRDGKLTAGPLTNADMANYRPLLAMDAAIGGPRSSPNFASYNAKDNGGGPVDRYAGYNRDLELPDGSGDPVDPSTDYDDDGSGDLESKIRQLLEGKLDDADLAMLMQLIGPDPEAEPMPATDRRGRRQAGDQRLVMPSKAEIMRRIAKSGEVRAERKAAEIRSLMDRFPALRSARVVG